MTAKLIIFTGIVVSVLGASVYLLGVLLASIVGGVLKTVKNRIGL